ncbi:hypothetical protein DFP92_10315 [Yoonia sediminilitoris]|uniref:Uncharacterized protein n=1 Tax=Yoonia sediminilitoris TaxID=1286148 RepID=A0A2T6KJL9_9RHOB|nr:hypothetical protein C8N45_10315 [Yoonia sediminilitoris]RCW96512.1 hypothetical protein DFP92_10315 [Yoonia sediminilitoris]
MRTKRTCAGAAFAHAENPCIRGIAIAALQLMSPKRSIKPPELGGYEICLLLHAFPSIWIALPLT